MTLTYGHLGTNTTKFPFSNLSLISDLRKLLSLNPPTMNIKSTPVGCFSYAATINSYTLSIIFANKTAKKDFIKSGGKSIDDAPHYFIDIDSSG